MLKKGNYLAFLSIKIAYKIILKKIIFYLYDIIFVKNFNNHNVIKSTLLNNSINER